jgi:7-cyano-7-deazaguanine synthase
MNAVAVLCSGGLDSAVLLAREAREAPALPVYVRSGLAWEREEQQLLGRLLAALRPSPNILPLATVQVDVQDLYPGSHWALQGTPPAYDTPDEDVYLPGRNLLLLSKAAVLCALRGINRIAVGPLAGNPFPDATPAFFESIARAASMGLDHELRVVAPFAHLHKEDVIRLGMDLGVPFELTLSCMNPSEGMHCGVCSKCRERRDAFAAAGIGDPTIYRAPSPRGGA